MTRDVAIVGAGYVGALAQVFAEAGLCRSSWTSMPAAWPP